MRLEVAANSAFAEAWQAFARFYGPAGRRWNEHPDWKQIAALDRLIVDLIDQGNQLMV